MAESFRVDRATADILLVLVRSVVHNVPLDLRFSEFLGRGLDAEVSHFSVQLHI